MIASFDLPFPADHGEFIHLRLLQRVDAWETVAAVLPIRIEEGSEEIVPQMIVPLGDDSCPAAFLQIAEYRRQHPQDLCRADTKSPGKLRPNQTIKHPIKLAVPAACQVGFAQPKGFVLQATSTTALVMNLNIPRITAVDFNTGSFQECAQLVFQCFHEGSLVCRPGVEKLHGGFSIRSVPPRSDRLPSVRRGARQRGISWGIPWGFPNRMCGRCGSEADGIPAARDAVCAKQPR